MENLGKDDLIQLLNFYRQKASDLEFQVLQLQININKINSKQSEPVPAIKTVVHKNNKTKE